MGYSLSQEESEQIRKWKTGQQLRIDWLLVHAVGLNNAAFITNLINRWDRYSQEERLTKDKMFFRTLEAQHFDTGLSHYAIRNAKRFFQEKGVLIIQGKGVPYKEYYKVNGEALDELVRQNPPPFSPYDYRKNRGTENSSDFASDDDGDSSSLDHGVAAKGNESGTLKGTNELDNNFKDNELVTLKEREVDTLSTMCCQSNVLSVNTYVFRNDVSRRAADDGEPDEVSEELYNRRKAVDGKVAAKINRKGNSNRKRKGSIHAAKTRKGNQSKLYNNRKGDHPSAETPSDRPNQDWTEADGIIQAWNALPGVARTRIADQPTQTLTRCRTILDNLLRGKPLTHRVEKTPAKLKRFLDRREADADLYRAKWTAQQITEVLQAIPGHKIAGDKPVLGSVLWNGFSKGQKNQGFSLFLWLASAHQADQPYRDRAERLAEVVQGVSAAKVTDRQIEAWAGDIRVLHEDHEVSLSRIDALLAWYNTHSNDDYVPVIHSGRDLLNKFTKLELAQKRAERQGERDKPHNLRGMLDGVEYWDRAHSTNS